MNYFGNREKNHQYSPEVEIWGHRLREGQYWIEYLIEFLSVLSGFKYEFGRTDKYYIPPRLGLKRFVFYDEREKTQDPRDLKAVELLKQNIKSKIQKNGSGSEEVLEQLRVLLRSFSVIEANRSWYAKSLFPVHEQFLLWEALRKGSTKYVHRNNVDVLHPNELDAGIEFLPRNFFARGGELYYLMISAGTEHDLDLRQRISHRLSTLLHRNTTLGNLAALVDTTWQELVGNGKHNTIESEPGWLPDKDCPLYRQFAEDIESLLASQLDPLESLELLAHLICFHIIIYIYHRAHPQSHSELHRSGQCLERCRAELVIDIPGDEDSQIIRYVSANQLRRHEQWQSDRLRAWVRDWVCNKVPQPSNTAVQDLLYQGEQFIENFIGNTRKAARTTFYKRFEQLKREAQQLTKEAIIDRFVELMYEIVEDNFRDHFLPIHRRLGRAIGLIAPQRGPQQRFVLGDTLLKTITLTVIRPDEQEIRFGEFLERLYQRYGIIIGLGEARSSTVLVRSGVNEGAFSRNRERLLERLKRAGLATLYSDATAMVRRS